MNSVISLLKHKAYMMRLACLKATTYAGSGHLTSCLSAADLVAALFFYAMKYDPYNPDNPENDQFILSKGHAAPLLYAAWQAAGVLTNQDILTLRQFNSVLEGHPTPRFSYVKVATGSLGQGLSIGAGMALSARLDTYDFRTYVLMGDSETTEGSVWEAAEISAYYNLDNLIGIIDVNRLGQSTATIEGHDLERYKVKFEAFGWKALAINGHDMTEIVHALDAARATQNQPVVIIAKTIKGYGLRNVENKEDYHGKAMSLDELPHLIRELEERFPHESETSLPEHHLHHAFPINRDAVKPHVYPLLKLPFDQLSASIDQEEATRKAYGEALAALGEVSPNVVSLDAEVKNSTFADIFEKKFPERFFQCFVAEQNMVGMGVGLAAQGKIPFISTFAAFMTRAHDQIRMAAISRSPLRLVGSHAGVSIGEDGPSQMGLEDIALMRDLPDSIVLYPCDAMSTYKLVELMANYNSGISYLRTTRGRTPSVYGPTQLFTIGGCTVLKQSPQDSVCIIAAGITLFEALKAHAQLAQEGIFISIIDCYCIKPLNTSTLVTTALAAGKRVITVEDHYLQGGLGEAVTYALRNNDITIECLAVTKLPRSGKPEELMHYERIDAAAIIQTVKNMPNH